MKPNTKDICTNCGKTLHIVGSVLDGNPKHREMCIECTKLVLEKPVIEDYLSAIKED